MLRIYSIWVSGSVQGVWHSVSDRNASESHWDTLRLWIYITLQILKLGNFLPSFKNVIFWVWFTMSICLHRWPGYKTFNSYQICCPRCHPTTPTLWHQLPPSISSPTTPSSPSPPTTPSPTCPPSQSQSRRSPACRSSWLSPRTALWSRRGRPSSTAQLYTVKRWHRTQTNEYKQMKTKACSVIFRKGYL